MTRNEFEALWDSSLRKELESLEVLRKQAKRALIAGTLVGFATGIPATLYLTSSPILDGDIRMALFLGMGCGGFTSYVLYPKQYRFLYKSKIIEVLSRKTKLAWNIWRTAEQMRPQRMKSILGIELPTTETEAHREIYTESGLFGTKADNISSDDAFIAPQTANFAVEIDAVHGSGKHRQQVFKGLIFRFNLARAFAGETYIREDKWGDGNVGTTNSQPLKITRLEWPEFEELFEIQTTDEVEAREILDPQFMEVLHAWWIEHKTPVRLSFKQQFMYLSVPGSNLFEPRPFSSIEKHKEELWHYLSVFLLAESLFSQIEHKYRLDLLGKHLN